MNQIFYLIIACATILSCSPHRQTTTVVSNRMITDSIEYYEVEVDARQKNYMHLLIGTWSIDTMRRQVRIAPEPLTNVHLTFNSDSTFTGRASCNQISGKYSVKGTGIRFSNIISTKMACDRLEQENEMLRLLQQIVSAYTVNENTLWLRDNSSTIVFGATRRTR